MPVVAAFALIAVTPACSSHPKDASDDSNHDEFAGETRDTEIKHEPCDPAGHTVKTFKADDPLSPAHSYVTHVFDGSREICSLADLNGDGFIDIYSYFADDGTLRRREASYSVGKSVEELAVYQAGHLQVVMRDTTYDGRLDTWDYYENDKLVRRERDKTGEGRLDEWWTFEPPGSDNATIVQADARTGKPDPAQALKINVAFYAAGPAPAAAPTPKPASDAGSGETGASTTPSPSPSGSGSSDAGAKKGAP